MEKANQTLVTYFILTGISDVPSLKVLVFLLVLLVYLLTIGGNMTILLLVCLDTQLHTPMYFFLGNLSFLDMSSINITLHKILSSFISGDTTISFLGCMTQFFIFSSLARDELLILTVMSYDRYVAICNPLRYHVVMNHQVCAQLATCCYVLGFTEMTPYIVLFSGFSCYKSNIINHFFCDFVPLMKVSCSDTSILELYTLIEGVSIGSGGPSILTIIPYVFILRAILKIRSSTGRRKAFYTCSSHLTVVILLYVTLICQYFRPTSMDNLESNKFLSLFNTAAVPLLNPVIYSLKNKDVKSAFRRRFKRF
ncbi:olfactory receptor 2AP1-like [Discoglossus pictus]